MFKPVHQRFSEAAHRYDQTAKIQKQAASQFDRWLVSLALEAPASIAEIGCGTGFFTRLLQRRFPNIPLVISDLAPGMVELCQAACAPSDLLHFEVCDGRTVRFSDQPDWLVSTMCFQWFDPLAPVLQHHIAQCKLLAFSVLLDGSFAEWQAAHQRLGLISGLQTLPTFDAVLDACNIPGIQHLHSQRISLSEAHQDGLAFARSLRAIGADHPLPQHQPVSLKAVCRQLEHGMSANYEIGFFCIER